MTDTITTDEFFKARAELRYKYFNQSDALQFTTVPEFVTRDLEYIAKNLSDLYFFYYYFNPKSQNGNPSEFKTEIEQTMKQLFAKYKDALLSLNQISNNQQLWI